MPVIMRETSVAANAVVDNFIAGSAFEFANRPQLASIAFAGAATGLVWSLTSGADLVLEEAAAPILTRFPIIPDEFYAADIMVPGDRLVLRVRNTTGAAIIGRAIVQVNPVA